MKPDWQDELEAGIKQLDDEVRRRRAVSTVDAVADGIAYAVSEMKVRVAVVTAPGRELTPAQWGARQEPPITDQAVRNWIRAGELEARSTPRGLRIAAIAQRNYDELSDAQQIVCLTQARAVLSAILTPPLPNALALQNPAPPLE